MRIVVYWVLLTVLGVTYKGSVDEFGRSTGGHVIDSAHVEYRYDTLFREFPDSTSALAFIEKAKTIGRIPKHIKTSDSTWCLVWKVDLKMGSQWVDTTWINKN